MRAVTLQDYKTRMLRVLVHIQQHLDDPLALDDLAAVACFSPFHFHRIFTGMMGESVKEHLRRLRLERAASKLKLGSAPVTRIALEAGYESHEAFTRSFSAVFGVPPSRFRATRRVGSDRAPSGVHYHAEHNPTHFRASQPGGSMKVEIKRMPPMRVAFVRHEGPYSEVGSAWDRLLPVLGKDGWLAGECMFIGICHDDPGITPADKIRYDACVTIGDDFAPSGEIGVQTIEGGDYAMTTHVGPYERLGRTYAALLGEWLPRSGREMKHSHCFEVYLNDPGSTEPAELLVDIYAPLEPAGAGATPRRKRR